MQTVIWVSLGFLAAYTFTEAVVMPLQAKFAPGLAPGLSLLFLPHGVRVIATWMLGWQSVPAILPGNVIVFYLLFADHPQMTWLCILTGIAVSCLIVPLVFDALSRLGMSGLFASGGRPRLRPVLIGGIIASIANAAFLTMFLDAGHVSFVGVIIGDTLGLILLLTILLCAFRFYLDKPPR